MEQAPQLDPSLEEEVIMAFRCQEVLTSAVFVALDSNEEGLKKTTKAFGINAESNDFVHKREMAKLVTAWQQGKIQRETKLKVAAVSRAHGEPVSMLPEDYELLLHTFRQKYGKIHDSKLTLAQTVSVAEEEAF